MKIAKPDNIVKYLAIKWRLDARVQPIPETSNLFTIHSSRVRPHPEVSRRVGAVLAHFYIRRHPDG